MKQALAANSKLHICRTSLPRHIVCYLRCSFKMMPERSLMRSSWWDRATLMRACGRSQNHRDLSAHKLSYQAIAATSGICHYEETAVECIWSVSYSNTEDHQDPSVTMLGLWSTMFSINWSSTLLLDGVFLSRNMEIGLHIHIWPKQPTSVSASIWRKLTWNLYVSFVDPPLSRSEFWSLPRSTKFSRGSSPCISSS